MTSTGDGLLSTFTPSTSTAKWIGTQILVGAGRGTLIQMPVLTTQTVLTPQQIPIGSSLVLFAQFFGGALFLGLGQTTFLNSLRPALGKNAPGVDIGALIGAGGSEIRKVVPGNQLEGVILAFNRAVACTFVSTCPFLIFWVSTGLI
jgi:hypothetical protein